MKMMLFVLDDPSQLTSLVSAWHEEGIDVFSIIDSSTLGEMLPLHIGARFSFGLPQRGIGSIEHITLLSILPDQPALETAIAVAEVLLGPLDAPNTGLLLTWELADVRGLNKLPSNHRQAGA